MSALFNVRAIYGAKLDRQYRVYFRDGFLYFIRVGGQDIGLAAAVQFGLLGGLLYGIFKKKADQKLQERSEKYDQSDPESLLGEHKDNLKINLSDIEETQLLPANSWMQHGVHIGRWAIVYDGGQKLTLELVTIEEMQTADTELSKIFGSKLQRQVEWNVAKKRYVKVK